MAASDDAEHQPAPTLQRDETQTLTQAHRGRWIRRLVVGALLAFVVAGALGAFGYRQSTATAGAGDLEVVLTHPRVTRGGLPAHWSVEVRSRSGAALPEVEISTTADYFDLFDENALSPQPDTEWQDEDEHWTFVPDDEHTLVVSLDARTQPNARWRHRATTTVRVSSEVVASFDYTTTVLP